MQTGVVAIGIVALVAASKSAFAQPPPPRTGFQVGIRTGYAVPMGALSEGKPLSDTTSGQVPLIVDLGGKVLPNLFVGGYWGLGVGGAAGAAKTHCDADNADCSTSGMHLGAEVQYFILPAGSIDPWLGYGLGFESLVLRSTKHGTTTTDSVSGFEFARFMAGVDFRVTRVFGVGPFVDLSLASFRALDTGSVSFDIPHPSTHEWLTFGARFVFFP